MVELILGASLALAAGTLLFGISLLAGHRLVVRQDQRALRRHDEMLTAREGRLAEEPDAP